MYTTELIETLLTSKFAKETVQRVTHKYGNAPIMLELFNAIGIEYDKITDIAGDLINQITPITATWSIPYWERSYGITPNDDWSIEQRRKNILSKMWSNGPMNPAKLAQILSSIAGADVFIKENTGKNCFTVYISTTPYKGNNIAINKKLDTLKPAHLIYKTVYTESMNSMLHIGGIIQKHKVITLPVNNAIYQHAVECTLNMGGAVQKCKVITLKES